MSLYVSSEDIARITCRKQKRKQIEQLVRMGIPHRVRPDGRPIVLTADFGPKPAARSEPKPPREWSEWREWPLAQLDGPAALLHQPCVYFLRAFCDDGRLGNVKIGYSKQLPIRMVEIMREFRFEKGWRLEVLNSIPGDKNIESHLHHRFAHAREPRGSEWFFPAEDLLAFIPTAHEYRL